MLDSDVGNLWQCHGMVLGALTMSVFYIARQPILDETGDTYGYELLFRSSNTNAYDPSIDGDTATSRVLSDAILESGIEALVGRSYAFINLTGRFLEKP